MRNFLLTLIAGLVLIALPSVASAASKTSKASDEQQVIVLLNQIRAQHNLSPFTANAQLRNAARFHSNDMLQKAYFEHDGLTESWDARIARFVKSPLTGEDIAWGTGSYGTPAGIVSQWMHSATHRAIILTPALKRIGIGLAAGTFDGAPGAVMATADFSA
jgi:uncharacterized protein YkwD